MDFIKKMLLGKEEISSIVKSLGEKISKDYEGKKLLLLSLLKGSVIFTADLMREITIPCQVDFMAVSSYTGTRNGGGKVNIIKDVTKDISGWNVLIVEDILESGYTLDCVVNMLKQRSPESVKICALLDKPNSRKTQIEAEYVGKKIPDEFVIGYGLDYNEKYRNLPFIGVIDPKYI